MIAEAHKKPLLKVENLRTYVPTLKGRAHAVDGISFVLEPGKTLGVVGESGCGKSVTAFSIMRLIFLLVLTLSLVACKQAAENETAVAETTDTSPSTSPNSSPASRRRPPARSMLS